MKIEEPERNYHIAIKDNTGEWIRRAVDLETYVYIRQLEYAIKYMNFKGIEKLYKERFGLRYERQDPQV